MKRRCAALLLALMALAAAAQPAERLPAVNLRIEWRWVETSRAATQGLDGHGGVSVGTGGVRDGGGSVTLRAQSRTQDNEVLQQMLVMNGGRASLRLAHDEPRTWVELFSTSRGSGAVLRQGWVESGRGVELRPRWRGGDMLDVELAADMATSPDEAQAVRRESLVTELRLRFGEWATVARSGALQRTAERGALSTRDVERSTQRELQLRVASPSPP
jgi:opacity protein-like surface antigen